MSESTAARCLEAWNACIGALREVGKLPAPPNAAAAKEAPHKGKPAAKPAAATETTATSVETGTGQAQCSTCFHWCKAHRRSRRGPFGRGHGRRRVLGESSVEGVAGATPTGQSEQEIAEPIKRPGGAAPAIWQISPEQSSIRELITKEVGLCGR
jgi:hypothetical protein